tara:strand:+ start:1566 stop:2111 length:546 start_codon:yes stop_codon:yes gene_type:complete
MAWLNTEELSQLVNTDGGGKFLSLQNGDSVQGLFVGEAYSYYKYWDNDTGRSIVGTKDGIAKLGHRPNLRIMQNFVGVDGSVKVFEGSKTFFKNLEDHIKTHMTADKPFAIQIGRTGEGINTQYLITVARDQVSDERISAQSVLASYDEQQLHNLEDIIAPQLASFQTNELVNDAFGNVSL